MGVSLTTIVPYDFVRERLVCEFAHWDICLVGLIRISGEYWGCIAIGDRDCKRYRVTKLNWTKECEEYLADYRASYHHWFYTDGRRESYDGRSLYDLSEKWGNKNPITKQLRPTAV